MATKALHPRLVPSLDFGQGKPARGGDGLILAPNHLQTVDPFVLFADVPRYVRWGALQRFFDAEDSIFGNSKNVFLRKATAWAFKRMGMFPISRDQENWEVFKELYKNAKAGMWIGLFPEGTTNKRPDEVLVQEPKRSVFVLCKDSGALMQPVALTWLSKQQRKQLGIKHRLVVNYRRAYPVSSFKGAQEAWVKSITEGICQNLQAVGLEPPFGGGGLIPEVNSM